MMDTLERARGRWREILPQLGIGAGFLTKQQGPCPICGGKGRFRYDDKEGRGTYYCNQCGPGDGVILLRKHHKWDFKTALEEVGKVLNTDAPVKIMAPRPVKSAKEKTAAIERLIHEATDANVVENYLTKRGLKVRSPVLKGFRACAYYDPAGNLVGRFPAVIAPIIGQDGALQSVQRIYITDLTPRKKVSPPVNTITGAAVRLHEYQGTLGVAEGVETALGAHEMTGISVWAALSANGLKAFMPPEGVKRLIVFGDHDANCVGQEAAYALACRVGKTGIAVEVHIPRDADTDWLDALNGGGCPPWGNGW